MQLMEIHYTQNGFQIINTEQNKSLHLNASFYFVLFCFLYYFLCLRFLVLLVLVLL